MWKPKLFHLLKPFFILISGNLLVQKYKPLKKLERIQEKTANSLKAQNLYYIPTAKNDVPCISLHPPPPKKRKLKRKRHWYASLDNSSQSLRAATLKVLPLAGYHHGFLIIGIWRRAIIPESKGPRFLWQTKTLYKGKRCRMYQSPTAHTEHCSHYRTLSSQLAFKKTVICD